MKKILFILKKRNIYSNNNYSTVNSGLYNSAMFLNKMLIENSIDSTLVEVIDNNEIDKYCSLYKPDVVIIEALWVVPNKFEILQKLHPNINWIIRLHSELPFLANEGIAIEWLNEYVKYKNVQIASNSVYLIEALSPYLESDIIYLPNYYPVTIEHVKRYIDKPIINIGLFGAIRPMKNTLTQAIAAINYANQEHKLLRLHINVGRIEQKGENVLKNLRALFKDSIHELIEYDWLQHDEFLKVVKQMDICLQVSLSETYNIVIADAVNQNIPVVTTTEIPFVNYFSKVKSNKDVNKIISAIKLNLFFRNISIIINKFLLRIDSFKSKEIWLNYCK